MTCEIEYHGTDNWGRTLLKTPYDVDKPMPLEMINSKDIQKAFEAGVLEQSDLTERDERILLDKGFMWVLQ